MEAGQRDAMILGLKIGEGATSQGLPSLEKLEKPRKETLLESPERNIALPTL